MSRPLPLLLTLALAGCHATPTENPQAEAREASSRATAMPDSLRCSRADDCTIQPICYWAPPTCVASATLVVPQCGSDADPPDPAREAVRCGCEAGQCVALESR